MREKNEREPRPSSALSDVQINIVTCACAFSLSPSFSREDDSLKRSRLLTREYLILLLLSLQASFFRAVGFTSSLSLFHSLISPLSSFFPVALGLFYLSRATFCFLIPVRVRVQPFVPAPQRVRAINSNVR